MLLLALLLLPLLYWQEQCRGTTHCIALHRTVCRLRHDRKFIHNCRFTGGDLQDTRPWGTGGVWLEPYDEDSANTSLRRLFDAWHQSPRDIMRKAGQAAGDGDASDAEDAAGVTKYLLCLNCC